jgi:hypothetical protein
MIKLFHFRKIYKLTFVAGPLALKSKALSVDNNLTLLVDNNSVGKIGLLVSQIIRNLHVDRLSKITSPPEIKV